MKYAAEAYIPYMISHSRWVTRDPRSASVSVVVLWSTCYQCSAGANHFGTHTHKRIHTAAQHTYSRTICFVHDVTIILHSFLHAVLLAPRSKKRNTMCLRTLAANSSAFKSTVPPGRDYFFIFTGDWGPCRTTGHYTDRVFDNHHLLVHAGVRGFSPSGHRCYNSSKDITIPTSNYNDIRPPLRARMVASGGVVEPALLTPLQERDWLPASRSLLAFFVMGRRTKARARVVELYGGDSDMVIREKMPANTTARQSIPDDAIRHICSNPAPPTCSDVTPCVYVLHAYE